MSCRPDVVQSRAVPSVPVVRTRVPSALSEALVSSRRARARVAFFGPPRCQRSAARGTSARTSFPSGPKAASRTGCPAGRNSVGRTGTPRPDPHQPVVGTGEHARAVGAERDARHRAPGGEDRALSRLHERLPERGRPRARRPRGPSREPSAGSAAGRSGAGRQPAPRARSPARRAPAGAPRAGSPGRRAPAGARRGVRKREDGDPAPSRPAPPRRPRSRAGAGGASGSDSARCRSSSRARLVIAFQASTGRVRTSWKIS